MRDAPVHWEMAFADFLETIGTSLRLDNFDNAECIQRQWVEMVLKKCASEDQEVKKNGMGGNKRLATDWGECVGNNVIGNLPELPNTPFLIVIR